MKKLMLMVVVTGMMLVQGCDVQPKIRLKAKIVRRVGIVTFGSTVQYIEKGARCIVKYRSHSFFTKELQEKATVQMWSESTLQQKVSQLPRGGCLWITTVANTIGAANPKYWEFIIQSMDGKELIRKSGRDSIPDFSVSSWSLTTTWRGFDSLSINHISEENFKVYVINTLSNVRSLCIIYPNQENVQEGN